MKYYDPSALFLSSKLLFTLRCHSNKLIQRNKVQVQTWDKSNPSFTDVDTSSSCLETDLLAVAGPGTCFMQENA